MLMVLKLLRCLVHISTLALKIAVQSVRMCARAGVRACGRSDL
jgi:hypothetical protein